MGSVWLNKISGNNRVNELLLVESTYSKLNSCYVSGKSLVEEKINGFLLLCEL